MRILNHEVVGQDTFEQHQEQVASQILDLQEVCKGQLQKMKLMAWAILANSVFTVIVGGIAFLVK